MKKKIFAVLCAFAIFVTGTCIPASSFSCRSTLSVQAPKNWEMTPGDSRSLDATFTNVDDAKRALTWESSNPLVATVDAWGRVTALSEGSAVIIARSKTNPALTNSAALTVTNTPAKTSSSSEKSFAQPAYSEADVQTLQKFVDRFTFAQAKANSAVPQAIKDCINESGELIVPAAAQTQAATIDGALWTIEDYGVLRTHLGESVERNQKQRFMSNRYLGDTTSPVIAIAADDSTGIWTINAGGVTHIRMQELSLEDKAILMSDTTQKYISRRGMTSNAFRSGDSWYSTENDNDGLWTAMYGAGEIFRFGTLNEKLKLDPNNAELRQQVEDARAVASQSAEAVLLLGNISAREGTVDAYVRYIENNDSPLFTVKTDYSPFALLKDKEYLVKTIDGAPTYKKLSSDPTMFTAVNPEDWAMPAVDTDKEYAKRTRLLTGFVSRTYALSGLETPHYNDGYYYDITGDTAVGITQKPLKNGEDINGNVISASLEIPQRLMKLINTVKKPGTDEYFSKDDIVYKADTSSDELIGHLFIYKIAYDILGPEDPELKQIIIDTTRRIAQHMVDNGYQLVDSTGQPTTWGKFNREWMQNGQTFGDAPLHSLVLLCTFKLAAHVTGEKKWEDEYLLAALGKDYAYADLAGEYWVRILDSFNRLLGGFPITSVINDEAVEYLARNFLGYSNEEMAMLAYYLIFQLEEDELLLKKFRKGIDAWWTSMQYSENPLWYYIYQLAYPNETKTDAYGNDLIETAAWSLSRHPIDTITWSATNIKRDDIAVINIGKSLGISGSVISYNKQTSIIDESQSAIMQAVSLFLGAMKLDYAVAAPDERSIHKYNGNSYQLESGRSPDRMEASTTYTLPYWMGRYHGLLQTQEVETDKTKLTAQVAAQESANLNEADYTKKSWGVYDAALANAQAILLKPGATQASIDSALAALTDAANSLKPANSLTALFEMIGELFSIIKVQLRNVFFCASPYIDEIIDYFTQKSLS